MSQKKYTIAIVCGEASADILGAHLIKSIRSHNKNIQFIGIGGEMMIQEGFMSLFNQENIMVWGFIDSIKNLPTILKIRKQLLKKLKEIKPDVFIGIDLPDFNFSIAKVLMKENIPTIHYVSPSVWAWKPHRVNKIIKLTKKVLCLFPHEPQIYQKVGGNAIFVGHPLALEYPLIPNVGRSKKILNLPENIPIFTIMPGSRCSEIKYMGELFIQTIPIILQKYPNAHFIIPTSTLQSNIKIQQLLKLDKYKNLPVRIIQNNSKDAITCADAVLVASGTATLEVALCKKPMVISYKISPIIYFMVKKNYLLKFIGLPNILLNKFIVPELIQNKATPITLATEIIKIFENKDKIKNLKYEFTNLHKLLQKNSQDLISQAILEELK